MIHSGVCSTKKESIFLLLLDVTNIMNESSFKKKLKTQSECLVHFVHSEATDCESEHNLNRSAFIQIEIPFNRSQKKKKFLSFYQRLQIY